MRRLRHLGLEGYRSGMLNFIRQWLKVSLFKKSREIILLVYARDFKVASFVPWGLYE